MLNTKLDFHSSSFNPFLYKVAVCDWCDIGFIVFGAIGQKNSFLQSYHRQIFISRQLTILTRCLLADGGNALSRHSDTATVAASHPSNNGGSRSGSRSHKSDQKTTRVRTVLNEKQLHTLRTCYGANPRPDALMKEQLVEMTGLSPRVIRVWFQNKRCKDKKRSMLMKQMQQQQQEKVTNASFIFRT
jgi:Homeodomain